MSILGWVLIDRKFATLPKESGVSVSSWVLLDRKFATLPKESGVSVSGWVLIDRKFATLKWNGLKPKTTPGEIPWGPIVGAVAVGVGAVVAGVAISKNKKKGK